MPAAKTIFFRKLSDLDLTLLITIESCFNFPGEKQDSFEFTCEVDEYAELVKCIKDSGLVKDHRQALIHTHKNSFIGKDVVDWLMKTREVGEYGMILFELPRD